MSQICTSCNSTIEKPQKQFVTGGLCMPCASDILMSAKKTNTFLNAFTSPLLLMQGEPRQVLTANAKACDLFAKNLSQIEGHRGGQVFDCIHSFTEAGCGKDQNCEDCKIKNAVVETFSAGTSSNGVRTILDIENNNKTTPYEIQIATEKIGDFALVRIDKYTPKA